MSYSTWHNYGYGICTDEISEDSVERLQTLLALAPKFEAEVKRWLANNEIEAPTWDDYMEFDEDYRLGLPTILKGVIEEAEGIPLMACGDFDDQGFLIYEPSYPWNLSDAEKGLTEEAVAAIFKRYLMVLTDEDIELDYQEVGNGG